MTVMLNDQSAAYGWTTLVRDDWGQPALACEQADATAFKEEFFPQLAGCPAPAA
jgi:hypothetical protein